jgi:hypothetical protein
MKLFNFLLMETFEFSLKFVLMLDIYVYIGCMWQMLTLNAWSDVHINAYSCFSNVGMSHLFLIKHT